MKASYETDFLTRRWSVEFNCPQIMALAASAGITTPPPPPPLDVDSGGPPSCDVVIVGCACL